MIIMCEKCEKKFRVDPTRITGEQARFRCRNCGNIMIVSRPAAAPPPSPIPKPPVSDQSEESRPSFASSFRLAPTEAEQPGVESSTGQFPSSLEFPGDRRDEEAAPPPADDARSTSESGAEPPPESRQEPSEEKRPTAEEQTHPEEESASPEEESASPEEESASPEEESASPEEESASPEEESASPEEESASPEEESASPEEEPHLQVPASRFGSMKPKIMFLFLVAGLVPLLAFAGVMIFLMKDQLASETVRVNAQASSELARQVDARLDESVRLLNTVAALPDMTGMETAKQGPVLKAVSANEPSFEFLCSVGPDGMSLARSDDQPAVSFEDRPYYKEIMEGKPLAWQRIPSSSGHGPTLALAVPIFRKGQVVGLLAGFVKTEALSAPVLEWKRGKTGTAFLLDDNARIVAHPQQELAQTQADFSSHPLGNKLKTGRGLSSFVIDGRRLAGDLAKTKLGWGVAVQQEEGEFYSLFQKILLYGGIILGCGTLLILLIGMTVARGLVRPLRELTDVADRISVGDLEGVVPVRSRDEIGALAEAISRLQESIRLSIERLRRRK